MALLARGVARAQFAPSAGIGASLSPEAVVAFDRDLEKLLAEKFPKEPLAVLHRVFAAIGRAPN